MSNIFYFDDNDTVHGPVTELEVQRWYLNGYFSSDAKFQITSSGKFEPKERIYSLGELMDLNGRTVPFYLSSEKVDREKKLEENLAKLMQEVESLRKNDQSMVRSQKDAITALTTQLTELVESNTSLQKQVDALSNKKETSPVTDQLDKKVNELKKRVDDQEKKVDSMKKEISAVNSKCDRNDSKLEQLLEIQKETEGTVTGFDKRIVDLKASEKSIRESLSACEQNAHSNSSQLQTITCDLSAIKVEMESQREEWSTNTAVLKSNLEEVQSALKELENNEELHREHNAAIDKAVQEDDVELSERLLNDSQRLKKSAPTVTESDIPPWEREGKKAVVVAESMEQEQLPWEKTTAKENESAPWEESREVPPFREMKGSSKISGKKETVVEAEGQKAGTGISTDQKQGKAVKAPATTVKAALEEKNISQAKDWAAICRALSDDDEDEKAEKEAVTTVIANLLAWTDDFIRDFVKMLRVYCAALHAGDFASLKQKSAAFDLTKMRHFYSMCDRKRPQHARTREAILREVRRLAATTIFCAACDFTATSPRHLFYHFTDLEHAHCSPEDAILFGAAYVEMTEVIANVFMLFIESAEEIDVAIRREEALNKEGSCRYLMLTPPRADHRPSSAFMMKMVTDATEISLDTLPPVYSHPDNKFPAFDCDDRGAQKRELSAKARAYFECTKRKKAFTRRFEKHVAEGVLTCGVCTMCFVNVEDYYKHMVSFDHAHRDTSIFGMCMNIWKGHEYWDAMMEEQR